MCTANISAVLSYLFRWSYLNVCCGLCRYRDKRKKEKEAEEAGDIVKSKEQTLASKV
jgi:hypothetical protein